MTAEVNFVSIVTPCFNAARYLGNCLDSVRHALQGRAYEHIVVDGGSTDGTVDILRGRGDVSFTTGPDAGMYDALNQGLRRARGAFIGHLNADEQYNRAGLQAALAVLDTGRWDAVFGSTVVLNEMLEFERLLHQRVVPRPVDAQWCMPVQTCSLLYRRQVWERLAYDATLRVVADQVWFRGQLEAGLRLHCVPATVGLFTWHESNLSHQQAAVRREDPAPGTDMNSPAIRLAKLIYRWRKIWHGAYWPGPLVYECFRAGKMQAVKVTRPRLRSTGQRPA